MSCGAFDRSRPPASTDRRCQHVERLERLFIDTVRLPTGQVALISSAPSTHGEARPQAASPWRHRDWLVYRRASEPPSRRAAIASRRAEPPDVEPPSIRAEPRAEQRRHRETRLPRAAPSAGVCRAAAPGADQVTRDGLTRSRVTPTVRVGYSGKLLLDG